MSLLLGLRYRVRSALHRLSGYDDTTDELADHLERQTRKHIAAGMSPADARRRATWELGGMSRWREETADVRSGAFIESLMSDCRYAFRSALARPGFALTALCTLALGIGASTTIFAVTNGALRRGLPYREPHRLMTLALRMPLEKSGADRVDMSWSYPKFVFFRDHQRTFESLSLFSPETVIITTDEGGERISGEAISASYFELLGIRPAIGRGFVADEDRPGGAAAVVVLSDRLWQTRLGGQRDAIGRTLTVAGVKHTIVGVMPPGFVGLSGDAQLWLPAVDTRNAAVLASAGSHNLQLIGRIAPGVSIAAAKHAVAALGDEVDARFPDLEDGRWGAAAYTFDERRVPPEIRRSLRLLSIAASLILVIVAVNLGILLLTRGAARRTELAVRLALGAGRGRVLQHMIVESVMLALIGSALGTLGALAAVRVLATTLPLAMPIAKGDTLNLTRLSFAAVRIDPTTIFFALALAIALGLGIGGIAALRATTSTPFAALRQGASTDGARRTRMRGGLVVAQVALSVVLVVVSGLTVQSLRLLRGRFFTEHDVANGWHVAIINRAAARAIWRDDDPLTTPLTDPRIDIVGIVDDARYGDLERPAEPALYVPLASSRGGLFVRPEGDPSALIAGIRRAIHSADPGHAIAGVQLAAKLYRDATARNRLTAQIFTAFALSALLLAAIGVYGTLALNVAQRSRELAVRRALGATSGALMRVVSMQAARLAGAGAVIGLALAAIAARIVASALYGVRAMEPSVYLVSAGLLIVAVIGAAALPTARSMRIDPRDAMRAE